MHSRLCAGALGFLTALTAYVASADTITLNNGKQFDGEIVTETDEAVTLRLPSGSTIDFMRATVRVCEHNGNGKLPAAVPPADGTVEKLWADAQELEQAGKYDAASAYYTAILAKDPNRGDIRLRVEHFDLLRRLHDATHPRQLARDVTVELRKLGQAAEPLLDLLLDTELKRLAEFVNADRVKKIRLSLARELLRRRQNALQFVADKSRYDTHRNNMGQEQVNELMRAVRLLYMNPADPLFLREDADYREVSESVDGLLEICDHAGYPEDKLAKARDHIALVQLALKKQLSFYDEDHAREEYQKVLQFNAAFTLGDSCKQLALLLNEYRIMMGLPPLQINELLNHAAQGHSDDMAAKDYFDHYAPDPNLREPKQRIAASHYNANDTGEVLTQGPRSPEEALASWQESADHHRAILRSLWLEFGLGLNGDLWTVNMATPGR